MEPIPLEVYQQQTGIPPIDNSTPHGTAALLDFMRIQGPEFTNNWKAIVASAPDGWLKCIRAIGGVLNITNCTNVLIRLRCDSVPDGFYAVSEKDVRIHGGHSNLRGYPDVELAHPHPERKGSRVGMDHATVNQFLAYLAEVKKHRGSVSIRSDHANMVQQPNYVFPFPFGVEKEAAVDPKYAIMAFMEARRYKEGFFIMRQVSENKNMPLIIGHDWDHCIVLMTHNSWEVPAREP
jgi:hypothetical protein